MKMGQALNKTLRLEIISLRKNGTSFKKISQDLGLHYNTVRKIWKRHEQEGEQGLVPKYSNCGKPSLVSDYRFYRASKWLKRHHQDWGAPFILYKLIQRYGKTDAPSARTLQRWFRVSGLNAPRQRHSEPRINRSKAVHNIWQMDAKEQLILEDKTEACYLTIVDEKSGGCLEAAVFSLSSNKSSSCTSG